DLQRLQRRVHPRQSRQQQSGSSLGQEHLLPREHQRLSTVTDAETGATGKPARRQSRLEWAKQRHDLPGRRATMEVPRPGSAARIRLGLAGVVLLALVLSACRTAPLPPPPPADLIVAGTDPTISAASFTLAAGEWKDFEIRVPTA